MLDLCLAGATGHVGRVLVKAISVAADLRLSAAVTRQGTGQPLADLLGEPCGATRAFPTVAAALAAHPAQVLVDYTHPDAVREHVRAAINADCHVVIGTSGLSDADYAEIDDLAKARGLGVFAAGNFSVTAALLQHFAALAARQFPQWEILDYGTAAKPDAPSGTARELAHQLGRVAQQELAVPVATTRGLKESRGAALNGTQVHSVRLPGYYSGIQAIFGGPGERVELRHESTSYAPYVAGTLLAARRVSLFKGLKRGMGTLLGLEDA